jgi:hypothetical protein
MAITRVQGGAAGSPGSVSSLAVTLAAATTSGNAIIAYLGYSLPSTTCTLTDDKGNVYATLPVDYSSSGYTQAIVYCLNITNGPMIFTATQNGVASYPHLIVDEFSGIGAFDVTNSTIYPSPAAQFSTGNVTPVSNGELLYTGGWAYVGGPMSVLSPFIFLQSPAAANFAANGYYVQPTAATIVATWTPPSSQPGTARIAAFTAGTPSKGNPAALMVGV